jgi:hypothetical protein
MPICLDAQLVADALPRKDVVPVLHLIRRSSAMMHLCESDLVFHHLARSPATLAGCAKVILEGKNGRPLQPCSCPEMPDTRRFKFQACGLSGCWESEADSLTPVYWSDNRRWCGTSWGEG